jgi:hypothetical protein
MSTTTSQAQQDALMVILCMTKHQGATLDVQHEGGYILATLTGPRTVAEYLITPRGDWDEVVVMTGMVA